MSDVRSGTIIFLKALYNDLIGVGGDEVTRYQEGTAERKVAAVQEVLDDWADARGSTSLHRLYDDVTEAIS